MNLTLTYEIPLQSTNYNGLTTFLYKILTNNLNFSDKIYTMLYYFGSLVTINNKTIYYIKRFSNIFKKTILINKYKSIYVLKYLSILINLSYSHIYELWDIGIIKGIIKYSIKQNYFNKTTEIIEYDKQIMQFLVVISNDQQIRHKIRKYYTIDQFSLIMNEISFDLIEYFTEFFHNLYIININRSLRINYETIATIIRCFLTRLLANSSIINWKIIYICIKNLFNNINIKIIELLSDDLLKLIELLKLVIQEQSIVENILTTIYAINCLEIIINYQQICWIISINKIPLRLIIDSNFIRTELIPLLLNNTFSLSSTTTKKYQSFNGMNQIPQLLNNSLLKTTKTQSIFAENIREYYLNHEISLIKLIDSIEYINLIVKHIITMNIVTFINHLINLYINIQFIGIWRIIISSSTNPSFTHENLLKQVIDILIAYFPAIPIDNSIIIEEYNEINCQLYEYTRELCLKLIELLLEPILLDETNHTNNNTNNTNQSILSNNNTNNNNNNNSINEFLLPTNTEISYLIQLYCFDYITNIKQFHSNNCYHCLSILILLANQTTQILIRREIIKNYLLIVNILWKYDSTNCLVPLLLLVNSCNDRIIKINENTEDKLLELIIIGLK